MDLSTLLPAGGIGAVGTGGLLALVILWLLSAHRASLKDYQEAIDRAEERADKAEERTRVERERNGELQRDLDEARTARRAAEDRAALAERELAAYRPMDMGGVP